MKLIRIITQYMRLMFLYLNLILDLEFLFLFDFTDISRLLVFFLSS